MSEEESDGDRACAAARGPYAGTPNHLDAPFWQTPLPVVERLLDLAEAGPDDLLIDLGCGDGRIVIAAARRGARAIGVDIDAERIAEAEAAAREAGVAHLTEFRCEDLFATRLDDATIVSLYLTTLANRLLAPRLRAEPKPGARIIGYCFPMHDWPADISETADHVQVNLWRVPG
ncbi:methyltransferase domain-containing protein [Sphingomonas sp. AOB5]|uniref:methyltransferase domain-containing protein n=1 Tax=Sphingomonas sp. AOB5 TaxID=3034017 RepID=UPI0023F97F34|nr:methyltransferase domain-containing protein [Sphingomonas sp. AOB5]MDF7773744.1 methyltransferase domain-containing protein [Sphingomonas sp. AOB5]